MHVFFQLGLRLKELSSVLRSIASGATSLCDGGNVKQVKNFLGQMARIESERFGNLLSEVHAAYEAGVLNPGLL